MKTKIFLMLVMTIFITSCAKQKVENNAKKAMENLIKEIVKDPKSLKISEKEIVFSDDSLCIIHVNVKAKNGFGADVESKMEYIYLLSNDTAYESIEDVKDNCIYVTEEDYNKKKDSQIYKDLEYKQGLYYLSSIYLNTSGRKVGDKEFKQIVDIPINLGTGSWELDYYLDEFMEKTASSYLRMQGKGIFSNSAITNSRLTAYLYIDKSSFSFKLLEYDDSLVKDDDTYTFTIKDANGEIQYFQYMYNYNGKITGYGDRYSGRNYYDDIIKILSEGGIITVKAVNNSYYSKDTYLFKMNVSGFDKAKEYLN
ncbi:MAG: hypothetical protein LUC88_05175 [Prevotella sp.]|nr:hypothetical protein [Prevotella sp.]